MLKSEILCPSIPCSISCPSSCTLYHTRSPPHRSYRMSPPITSVNNCSNILYSRLYLNTKRELFIRNISPHLLLCYLAHLVTILPPTTALLRVPLPGPVLSLGVALLPPPPGILQEGLGGALGRVMLLYYEECCSRLSSISRPGINQEESTAPGGCTAEM